MRHGKMGLNCMPVILFAVFIDLLGFGIIVPILPYLAMKFGGDAVMGAALISIYSGAAFIMGPIWGRFSDKFGRKPALAGTFFGAAISYVVLGFADTVFLLFLARAMSGAMAGNVGIAMAAVADVTTEENRGKAMGKIGAAFGLGFAFGPGIGGVLSSVGTTQEGDVNILAASSLAAALSFLAMVLTAIYVPETNKNRLEGAEARKNAPNWREVIRQPGQALLLLMFVVTAIGQSVSFALTPFWATEVLGWGPMEVGYLLMATGMFVFFLQLYGVGPLFKHLGEVKSLMVGVAINITGCAIIILMPVTAVTATIGFPLVMGGLTLAFPALNSLVSKRTCKNLQGTALGMSNGFSALGRVAGPVATAPLFLSNTNAPFLVIAAAGLVVFAWSTREVMRSNRNGEREKVTV